MEFILCAVNPATGTDLSMLPFLIISGIVVVGCIIAAVVSKNMKNKKGNKKKTGEDFDDE